MYWKGRIYFASDRDGTRVVSSGSATLQLPLLLTNVVKSLMNEVEFINNDAL